MSPSLRALLVVLGLLGATEVVGQEAVTALDRTLSKTHMRQDTTYVAIADAPVQAFASDDDSVWKAELYGES
jgi:hypothetical protein